MKWGISREIPKTSKLWQIGEDFICSWRRNGFEAWQEEEDGQRQVFQMFWLRQDIGDMGGHWTAAVE